MAMVDGICTNCKSKINIDEEKDAGICPICNCAFVTDKAVALYKSNGQEKKKRHVLKSLGKGLLMTLECIGYLIYVITLMWLFFDIVDDVKKK